MPRLVYCWLSRNCWKVLNPFWESEERGTFSRSQQIWFGLFFIWESRTKIFLDTPTHTLLKTHPHYSKPYLDISPNFLFQNNVVPKLLPALWFLFGYWGNQVTVLCISAIICRIEFHLCVTLIEKMELKWWLLSHVPVWWCWSLDVGSLPERWLQDSLKKRNPPGRNQLKDFFMKVLISSSLMYISSQLEKMKSMLRCTLYWHRLGLNAKYTFQASHVAVDDAWLHWRLLCHRLDQGVPLGSVLGPLLRICCILPLANAVVLWCGWHPDLYLKQNHNYTNLRHSDHLPHRDKDIHFFLTTNHCPSLRFTFHTQFFFYSPTKPSTTSSVVPHRPASPKHSHL